MDEKKLILSLIQDDLLSQKLIYNLNDIGIDAQTYHLHLSHTIFKFMGIECPVDDKKFASYILLAETAKHFPLEDREKFVRFAEEIYTYLDSLREPTLQQLTIQQGKLHRLVRDLIKIDLVNFRSYKKLEHIGLDQHGNLFPLMEVIFDFMGIEDRTDEEIDIASGAYFEKSLAVMNLPKNPDYEVDRLADEVFDLILSYAKQPRKQ